MAELFAEDVNYWQTGQSAPDVWMDKAKRQLEKIGGIVLAEGFGSDIHGRSAYMLQFQIENVVYKLVWPVLPSKTGRVSAARRQAATMIYHDVKAKCVSSQVLGHRSAFFSYMQLPDGRTAVEATVPELTEGIPRMLLPRRNQEDTYGEITG